MVSVQARDRQNARANTMSASNNYCTHAAELGDAEEVGGAAGGGAGYVSELRMLPSQSQGSELEAEAARMHRLHRGQTPAEAELNFLNRAKFSDYYGVRLYPALVRSLLCCSLESAALFTCRCSLDVSCKYSSRTRA